MEQESTTKHCLHRSLNQSFSKENVKGDFKMEQASLAKRVSFKKKGLGSHKGVGIYARPH